MRKLFLIFLAPVITGVVIVPSAARAFIYAPCCLSARSTSQTVAIVSWVAVSADPAATGYTLERESPIGGGFTTILINSNVTSYTDSNLSPGGTYNYRVSAVNSEGTGPASSAYAITMPSIVASTPPGKPANLSATASGATSITISWTAPSSSSTITGYRIEREAPYGSGFVILVSNTGSSATSYTDSSLSPGVTYNYRVTAISAYGVGIMSANAYATTPTKPDAPRNLKVTPGDGKLLATWDPPLFLGGGITGYTLGALESTSTADISGSAASGTLTGLTNGTLYTLTLKAYNAAGSGPVILGSPTAPVRSAPVPAQATSTPTATTTPSAAPPTPSSYKFTVPLYRGSRGKDVMELQRRLIAEKFLSSEITGYFGVLTEAAVKNYQKSKGLPQVGTVGPLTRAALNQ
jgi:titin